MSLVQSNPRRRAHRSAATLLALATTGAFTTPALAGADPSPAACAQAHDAAQLDRRGQRLVEARQPLATCASEACPAATRTECAAWLQEVEAKIPSVTFEARAGGETVRDVQVSVDGAVVATALDGRPVEVDPGVHEVTFARAGKPTLRQKVVVQAGAKDARLIADWKAAESAPAAALSTGGGTRPVPASVFVLGGISLAGLADFAIASAAGNAKKSDVEVQRCAPFCNDDTKLRYGIADIGLGVSAAAAAAAGILYLTRPTRPPPVQVGVSPTKAGGTISLKGRF